MFIILSFITFRAVDYALPLMALSLGYSYKNMANKNILFTILGLFMFSNIIFLIRVNIPDNRKTIKEALNSIPSGPARIYNHTWDLGSYVMYYRKDLEFIDTLDSNLLKMMNPSWAQKKEELHRPDPNEVDIYQTIKNTFKSQYIVGQSSFFNNILAKDPRFKKLYSSKDPEFTIQVYKLK